MTSATPASDRLRRTSRVIGLTATLLVAVPIHLLASITLWDISNTSWRHAELRAESRTRTGPLRLTRYQVSEAAVLARLPETAAMAGDGIRFVASPSFNQRSFGIALWFPPNGRRAEGRYVSVLNDRPSCDPVSARFTMPVSAFQDFMWLVDDMNDDWGGSDGLVIDGTPSAFERVRGQQVTSARGNDEHQARLALMFHYIALRFVRGAHVPGEADWHESNLGDPDAKQRPPADCAAQRG